MYACMSVRAETRDSALGQLLCGLLQPYARLVAGGLLRFVRGHSRLLSFRRAYYPAVVARQTFAQTQHDMCPWESHPGACDAALAAAFRRLDWS